MLFLANTTFKVSSQLVTELDFKNAFSITKDSVKDNLDLFGFPQCVFFYKTFSTHLVLQGQDVCSYTRATDRVRKLSHSALSLFSYSSLSPSKTVALTFGVVFPNGTCVAIAFTTSHWLNDVHDFRSIPSPQLDGPSTRYRCPSGAIADFSFNVSLAPLVPILALPILMLPPLPIRPLPAPIPTLTPLPQDPVAVAFKVHQRLVLLLLPGELH
jgi:hypothetical protein